jgi:ribose-phosphate pyrophosphokinase
MGKGNASKLRVFAGRHSRALTEAVCAHMDLPVADGRTESFPDGELIVKVDEDVRGRDCYVVVSTCAPVNDNLMELLVYIDCLRRASASRVTAVIPYFGYARQDRKDEGRTPITAKLVANLITKAGADRVLAVDLHAAQIQGFFDIPVDHLSAAPVFLEYFTSIREALGDVVLVSPDVGNVKVAKMFATLLNVDIAIVDKRRVSGSEVASTNLIGSVNGRTVLMIDDMISTAGTVCEAARIVMDKGAKDVFVAATHPVLVGLAMQRLVDSPISRIVVTDTIPAGDRYRDLDGRMEVLSIGPLLGDAIYRIHQHRSVSALFKRAGGTKR